VKATQRGSWFSASNPGSIEGTKGKSVKHERHANAAEEGQSANINLNTTNKDAFDAAGLASRAT